MFLSQERNETAQSAVHEPPPEYQYQGLTLRELEQMVLSQHESIKNLNKRVSELEEKIK